VTTLAPANAHLSYASMTSRSALCTRLSQPLPNAYPWPIHLAALTRYRIPAAARSISRPADRSTARRLTRGLPWHLAA